MSPELWAGWRMVYLREARDPTLPECLFCALAGRAPSVETLVLERYEFSFLVLNAFPYTAGHVMVAPVAHGESLLGESDRARSEMQAALERVRLALLQEYRPDGFNVGSNLGKAAGAGVLGHLHWHLVPRWQGDTNFVPALTGTRVIPEALPDTYGRLLHALEGVPEADLLVRERGRVP